MLIGLISDTHGLLRPQALVALQSVQWILHAGDIGGGEILERLGRIAPVTAVRGNNDKDDWSKTLPTEARLTFEGVTIRMIHDRKELQQAPDRTEPLVVVSGHSHKPGIEHQGGILHINPGSAGPRRFKLPITVGFLALHQGRAHAWIEELEV